MTLTTLLRHARKECALRTVKDAAELTGLTEWWVRQLIAKGEIRAMNVGSYGKSIRGNIGYLDNAPTAPSHANSEPLHTCSQHRPRLCAPTDASSQRPGSRSPETRRCTCTNEQRLRLDSQQSDRDVDTVRAIVESDDWW